MIGDYYRELISVFTLWQWSRLWTGSLLSFAALGFLHFDMGVSGNGMVVPIALTALGASCTWPVVLQEAFGPPSDPDRILEEMKDRPDE